jgi:L-lactate dehydrogenase complex protein LldG
VVAPMSTARADILDRVRQAAAIRPASPPVPRDYRGAGAVHVSDLAGLLTERLADYGATVHRCNADQVASTLRAILAGRGKRRILTPARLPEAWVASVPEPIGEQPPLSTQELDAVDGVITTVTVAIAQTGTLVLDAGPGQGPRALTLVPDFHLAVVLAEQIVAAVPDAIAAIVPSRPLTWISGPSATSDIELNRVEGVHGPRVLDVLIVDPRPEDASTSR